jgi:hypothetical protein
MYIYIHIYVLHLAQALCYRPKVLEVNLGEVLRERAHGVLERAWGGGLVHSPLQPPLPHVVDSDRSVRRTRIRGISDGRLRVCVCVCVCVFSCGIPCIPPMS